GQDHGANDPPEPARPPNFFGHVAWRAGYRCSPGAASRPRTACTIRQGSRDPLAGGIAGSAQSLRSESAPVPFLDLRAQDAEVGAEVRAAVEAVLDTQQLVLGSRVAGFEEAMAAYCGVPHAVGVNSGTDAL